MTKHDWLITLTIEWYCNVKDGLLHLMNWNNNQSIRGNNMNMNIEKGTVIIRYWRLDLVNSCDPGICARRKNYWL